MNLTFSTKDEYKRIRRQLEPFWGIQEADSITFMLFEHFYQIKRNDILTDKQIEVSKEVEQKLKQSLNRLERKEPIQYILGSTEFSGFHFKISKEVLIPRSETEELVDLIVRENKVKEPKVIDIGTGSGCIAVSLAKLIPGASIIAIDIDENAINLARENAAFNHVDLTFLQSDILSDSIPGSEFDIVVSNPPYVQQSERNLLDENVLKYEPDKALFVPDDNPLIFYTVIARKAKPKIKHNGFLYFEINEVFGHEICDLLYKEGYRHIKLFYDINNKPRIIQANNN